MGVIFDTTNNQCFAVVNAQNLGEVCMHFVAQFFITQERKSIFG
jgi:hypothetical protein